MLLKMIRTQKTAIGLLAGGMVYAFDPDDFDQKAVADRLLAHEPPLAEKTSKEKLKKEKLKAEAIDHTTPAAVEASQAETLGLAVLAGIAAQKTLDEIQIAIEDESAPAKIKKLETARAAAVADQDAAHEAFKAAGGE